MGFSQATVHALDRACTVANKDGLNENDKSTLDTLPRDNILLLIGQSCRIYDIYTFLQACGGFRRQERLRRPAGRKKGRYTGQNYKSRIILEESEKQKNDENMPG